MVTLQDAKEVTDVIIRSADPLSVIVFGSVAKAGSGEDLDVFIITDDTAGEPVAIERKIHRDLKLFYKKFPIDHFVVTLSLFRKYHESGSPFLISILREGRFFYMKGAVKEWIRQSEDEWRMAAYLMGGGYFKGACYHAQQSIEKSIKARLLKRGWDLEKTHSIERLLALCEEYGLKVSLTDDEVFFIDSIYRGRYPAEAGLLPLGEPTKADSERAVAIAWRMLDEARREIGSI